MIPLRDVIPSRTTPWVTWALIAANVAVFIRQLGDPAGFEHSFYRFGLVPAHFTWLAVLTSMFAHGGWLHIGSNMLCLWIFGDNVEDRMGHLRYLVFYLLAGVAAAFLELHFDAGSLLPQLGASGAIAGVMGAYLVMYPHSRIHVLVLLLFYIDVIEVPAIVFLVIWFLLQLVGGFGRAAAETGGVAFWAHIGGFAAGVVAAAFFRRPQPEWWTR